MAVNYATTIIIITLLLLVFVMFTGSLGGTIKTWSCKNSLTDEIKRIESIACTMDEDQISYDILDLSKAKCLESIYYDDSTLQLCYKYIDEKELECHIRRCADYDKSESSIIEYVGFKKEPRIVTRDESRKYDIIIEPQKISLFTCTGEATPCRDFYNFDDCTEHGCHWRARDGMCLGKRPSCEEFSDNQEKCEYEGCVWIGE